MSDNFFKVKNGLNLPTLAADPTVTPPANSVAGDLAFYNGRLYAHNGTAWGIRPGSGPNGLITNVDVEATAAIDGSKIVAASASVPGVVTTGAQTLAGVKTFSSNPAFSAMATAGIVHNAAGTGALTSSLIVNADVDAAAAIAGTKVDPNFGSQNISTLGTITANGASSKLTVTANSPIEAVYIEQAGTGNALVVADQVSDTTATVIDANGNMGVGVSPSADLSLNGKFTVAGDVRVSTGDIKLDTAKGIESFAAASTLNVGTGTNTTTLNLGTGSSTQTVNIGTGAGTTTINIGGAGDTVNVAGTLTWLQTTNLEVSDKLVAINKGGTTVGGNGAGVQVLGDANAAIAQVLYDSATTSKWKVGAAGTEAEVVTVSDAQTLTNKTVGTLIAQSGTLSLTGTGALKIPVGTSAQQPVGVQGMIRYDTTASAFQGFDGTAWSSIGGATTIDRVTQASHGFVAGDVLYMNGATYAKAKADVAATAEVVGMVSRVIDASTFELTICGEVSGLSGLIAGENYFLSAATAGALTAVEPSVVGQISLPMGVASSTTSFYVAVKRGAVVGGANLRTAIGLSNNATTNVQNVSAYHAGELTGWVEIVNTTAANSLKFFVRAAFAKNGAATDYNLSYQTTGDTPPAGFSMGVTAAGIITATLPNVSGFSSAYINFALNAPAVGTTLPLQIDSGLVTNNGITGVTGAVATTVTTSGSGKVGEYRTANSTTLVTTGNTSLVTLPLSEGTWLLSGGFRMGGDATARYMLGSINNVSGTHDSVSGRVMLTDYNTTSGNGSVCIPNRVVVVSSGSENWYVVGQTSSVSGISSTNTHIMAVRIA